jgi:hypothetical protein
MVHRSKPSRKTRARRMSTSSRRTRTRRKRTRHKRLNPRLLGGAAKGVPPAAAEGVPPAATEGVPPAPAPAAAPAAAPAPAPAPAEGVPKRVDYSVDVDIPFDNSLISKINSNYGVHPSGTEPMYIVFEFHGCMYPEYKDDPLKRATNKNYPPPGTILVTYTNVGESKRTRGRLSKLTGDHPPLDIHVTHSTLGLLHVLQSAGTTDIFDKEGCLTPGLGVPLKHMNEHKQSLEYPRRDKPSYRQYCRTCCPEKPTFHIEPEPELEMFQEKAIPFHDIQLEFNLLDQDGIRPYYVVHSFEETTDGIFTADVNFGSIYIVYQGKVKALTFGSIVKIIEGIGHFRSPATPTRLEFSMSECMDYIYTTILQGEDALPHLTIPSGVPGRMTLITLSDLRQLYTPKKPPIQFISNCCRISLSGSVSKETVVESKQDDPSLYCYLKQNKLRETDPEIREIVEILNTNGIQSKSDILETFMDIASTLRGDVCLTLQDLYRLIEDPEYEKITLHNLLHLATPM